jgi:hypothetical protein
MEDSMILRRFLMATCVATGLISVPAGTIFAAPPTEKSPPALEPEALEALTKMSTYLRTLKSFEMRSETVREEIDSRDQKLQFLGTTTYKARAPNGLVVEVAEDRRIRRFVYDGKSATLLAPRMGFYATVAAPPTIRELLDVLNKKYGVAFPLEDLFLWGTDADHRKNLQRGYLVGFARIGGQDADQYAFREKGLDWQIWVARGPKPLPLRVVIAGTSDPKLPQMEASLKWNTEPKFAADTFVFKPPAGAKPITIASREP